MLFGIINVNKPQGFTSHDVVAKLRRILNTKKIGHTGTLDPLATGVLPICVGKATKFIQYFEDTKKYRASLKLGIITDTYDTEGKVIEENSVNFDKTELEKALKDFRGEITQTPPIYSAVHYKGKRLYEYARKNIEIPDIPTRKVFIKSIELIEVQDENSKNPTVVIDVDCSSGTYIRSIVNDLGAKLGYGATMCGLIRTRAGEFSIEDSWTIEKIEEFAKNNKLEEFFMEPIDFVNLKSLDLTDVDMNEIKNGRYLIFKKEGFNETEKIKLIYNNQIVAIAEYRENKIHPKTVFNLEGK